MKTSLLAFFGLFFILFVVPGSFAQDATTEQEIAHLSKEKWQWMAEKNVDKLIPLFHDASKFVHMSGTWGKDREIEIIQSGSIHYKQADVHEVAVEVVGDTAILWNRITLLAEV